MPASKMITISLQASCHEQNRNFQSGSVYCNVCNTLAKRYMLLVIPAKAGIHCEMAPAAGGYLSFLHSAKV